MAKETRQKIIAATSALLEQQGYHATGLNQIVQESCTPRGSLYYYFPDGKEELAAEAVTFRMTNMAEHTRQLLNKTADPIEAIVGMIRGMGQHMADSGCAKGAPIAAVALEASNSSPRLREACAAGYQKLQDVLTAKLVLGGFPAERASRLGMMIVSTIEGSMILSRTKQDASHLTAVAEEVEALLRAAKA